MLSVSVSLPIISWLILFAIFVLQANGFRKSFLMASVAWGCVLTAIFELLSLGGWLNRPALAVSWAVAALAGGILLARMPKAEGCLRIPTPGKGDFPLIAGIVLIAVLTGVTAFVAPPNNWDSMTYHLGRVVHWIQNGSVAHYPTHIARQLYSPPWAEFALANLMLLWDGDRLVNLVQWFAMLGSVLAVSLIARQLSAGKGGEIAAAALCAAIPMGVLQASSTQNDYVVAFWLASFVFFGMELLEKPSRSATIFVGAALGLAVLTKGVAYVYASPFIVWFLLTWLKRHPRKVVPHLAAVVLIFLAINIGHYSRNYNLFGNPLSTDTTVLTNEVVSFGSFASNASRNFMSHFVTTSEGINNSIGEGLFAFHNSLKMDIHDPRITLGSGFGIVPAMFHEDYAGNGLHVVIILVAVGILLCNARVRRESPAAAGYVAAMCLALLLYCLVFKWQIWGSRLQLSLFVLLVPVAAAVFSRASRFLAPAAAVTAVASALPWCVLNQTKPMSGGMSIFTMPRTAQYFSSNLPLREKYEAYADAILRTGCTDVALSMNEDAYEYPLWVLVRQKTARMPRIEHVDVKNRSGAIHLKKFAPSCTLNL